MEDCKLNTLLVLTVSLIFCSSMKACTGIGTGTKTTNAYVTSTQFIKAYCNATKYQDLCFKSLSSYSKKISTNYTKLVNTSLSLSLRTTKTSYTVVLNLSRQKNIKPNEAAAMRECIEEIRDSIDEVKQSLKVMKSINAKNFDYGINNIQAWLGAAVTEEDTCMDRLAQGSVNAKDRNTIKTEISDIAQMTSNALAIVNRAPKMSNDTLP